MYSWYKYFISKEVFYRIFYFLIYSQCILLLEKCFIGISLVQYVQLLYFNIREVFYWVFYLLMYSQYVFYYQGSVLLGILLPDKCFMGTLLAYIQLMYFITQEVIYQVFYSGSFPGGEEFSASVWGRYQPSIATNLGSY